MLYRRIEADLGGNAPARSRGELQHLAPGEERRYALEIGAHAGTPEIDAFTDRARQLAGPVREEVR